MGCFTTRALAQVTAPRSGRGAVPGTRRGGEAGAGTAGGVSRKGIQPGRGTEGGGRAPGRRAAGPLSRPRTSSVPPCRQTADQPRPRPRARAACPRPLVGRSAAGGAVAARHGGGRAQEAGRSSRLRRSRPRRRARGGGERRTHRGPRPPAPFNGQLALAQQGPAAGKTLNPTQASVAAVEQKPESFGWRQ